jgi:phosphate acetyltransferase
MKTLWSATWPQAVAEQCKAFGRLRILFPEGEDERIRRAALEVMRMDLGQPLLFAPDTPEGVEGYWHSEFKSPEERLWTASEWLRTGRTDIVVSGARVDSALVLRIGLSAFGIAHGYRKLTGCMVIDTGNPDFGHDGVMLFADPIVIPKPTGVDYVDIAEGACTTWNRLFPDVIPLVAVVDYKTCPGEVSQRHRELAAWANQGHRNVHLDGPLQVDAALVREVGSQKAPHSYVAGQANILIFPDLASANIGYKIAQRMSGGIAIPVLNGLSANWHDLSRGCTWREVVLQCVLAVIQSQTSTTKA